MILEVTLDRHNRHGPFGVNKRDNVKQPSVVGVQDRLSILHANTLCLRAHELHIDEFDNLLRLSFNLLCKGFNGNSCIA